MVAISSSSRRRSTWVLGAGDRWSRVQACRGIKTMASKNIGPKCLVLLCSLLLCGFSLSVLAASRYIADGAPGRDGPSRCHRRETKNATKEGRRDREFPYETTCRKGDLHRFLRQNRNDLANFTVGLVYHVGMVKNWRAILADQMTTLNECGLLEIADEFVVSYSNGDEDELLDAVARSTDRNMTSKTKESAGVPWEGPAMNAIREYCREQPAPESSVVFYFHNKGVSKWEEDWRDDITNKACTQTYAHSLYWRKYLEYFLTERPHLCLDQILLQNASTCGANWHVMPKNHYSGNFWSASCEHVLKLGPMADTNYFAAEFWLGRVRGRHSSFHSTTKDLYGELILPGEYSSNFSVWYDERKQASVEAKAGEEMSSSRGRTCHESRQWTTFGGAIAAVALLVA